MATELRGETVVLTADEWQRNEHGLWQRVERYEGTENAVVSRATNAPTGVQVGLSKGGGVGRVELRYGNLNDGNETPALRWELDKELLDKDILYSKLAGYLSPAAKREFIEWRKNPESLTLPLILQEASEEETEAYMALQEEVLRGVESFQIATLVLKRTRTMSARLAPVIVLEEQEYFYETGDLIDIEGIPTDLANKLPAVPYEPPTGTSWGWLPRAANRSYIGQSMVEEYNDWVFAAWSTSFYTLY